MPPPSKDFVVAICGAGMAGLGLALALHSHGIKCTIYEAADTPERGLRGSVQLAPNGQAALDRYGILSDLLQESRIFTTGGRLMKSDGTLLNEFSLGDKEIFGYDAMRIVRRTLAVGLANAVRDRGMQIVYNKKYVHVVSEDDAGVTIEFADGTTANASLLVGADGIYSRLRKSIHPDVELQYVGSVAVGGSVPASKLAGLDEKSYGLFVNPIGSAMIGPHTPNDTEYIAFISKPYPDIGKEGWKQMYGDKSKLREFVNNGSDVWLPYIQSAIANLRDDDLFLWPMHVLPELRSWTSQAGKIVLIGDAAHAMPPTAGQGANMAFEDGYTLGMLLASVGDKISLGAALHFWEDMRKERIRKVLEMTMQWAKMREPPNSKNAISEYKAFKGAATHDARIEQMRWLFCGIDVQDEQIKKWVTEKQ